MRLPRHLVSKVLIIGVVGCAGIASENWSRTGPGHDAVSRLVASHVGAVAGVFGLPTYVDGARVYSLGFSVRVVAKCNGAVAAVVVGLGIGLLSAPVRKRLLWAVLGALAVHLVNLCRVFTILAIGTRSVSGATILHERVSPILWICLFSGFSIAWLRNELDARSAENEASNEAPRRDWNSPGPVMAATGDATSPDADR
jgi:exosortase/archaeosortase family protein